jgi:hypothetical protein
MNQEKIDCISAIVQNGWALEFASLELRADKEVVIAAVTKRGFTLQFASVELREDKEVVLAAVIQNGWTIRLSFDSLRNDKDIVLAAVAQNVLTLKYASNELRDDEYFLYEIDQFHKITTNSRIFTYVSKRVREEIKNNQDYLLNFEQVYLKPAKK